MIAAAGTALVVLAAACSGGSSSRNSTVRGGQPAPMSVGCDQVILRPRHPFADGYRRVLGVLAVRPAYIPQVVAITGQGWPYWEKAGLVVHAGHEPVTVSVGPGWQRRAAITWGNGKPAVESVRIAACPSPGNVWNAYAGGFFLRSHGACVPLVFTVGGRARTVRFGIDRRCAS
jgi:hypothetical protein